MVFIGWSQMQDSDKAEYLVRDIVELSESIQLYPVFSLLEDDSSVDINIIGDTEDTGNEFDNSFSIELDSELDDELNVSNTKPLIE